MFKKIVLPFLLLVSSTSMAQNVGLFEECNYAGRSFYLPPGSYKRYAMKVSNDQLSSIQIPNGMRVTVYEADDFKGRSVTLTSSTACLTDGFNDNVSSLVIETLNYNYNNNNNYSSGAIPQNIGLFEGCNYTGKSYYLAPGSYKRYAMKVSNDQLSSLQIPYGMRVTVYEADDFKGRSVTLTSNTPCLTDGFNDNVSSIVVESLAYNNNNNNWGNNNYYGNEYVTFYNACYSKDYSQSLRPGTYHGNQLGILKQNISSFQISGNLRVKLYLTSDEASGYFVNFDESQSCLSSSYNDKVRSIVIERRQDNSNYPNYNNTNYATVYTDCNYGGNSLRLEPGYYQGDKLGLLRYNISSIEIPSNLRAKVYVNNEYLSGTSYTITENSSCLSSTLNNRIGSLVIEERYGYGNNNNYNNNNNYYNQNQVVVIYSENNYQGLSAALLPGSYATMQEAGFVDNNLSSLQLPEGFRVVLYDLPNFQGKKYTVYQSKTGFSFSGWNDKASSIVVYRD